MSKEIANFAWHFANNGVNIWVPRKPTFIYAECPGYETLKQIDDVIGHLAFILLKKEKTKKQ